MMQLIRFISNQIAPIRHETRGGTQYLVSPAVIVKEAVLNGEYLPLEEVHKFPAAWNGRPFVIGHPKGEDGSDVSANDPERLRELQAGFLFNTEAVDSRLTTEIWVDVARAKLLAGGPEVLQRLEQARPLELSTAYWRDQEKKQGTHGGVEYEAVARNLRPDHLAALLDVEGACSWEDGCGAPRVNQDEEPGGPNVCVCPDCGYEAPKERGVPCRSMTCPKCDAGLVAGEDAQAAAQQLLDKEPEKENKSMTDNRILGVLQTLIDALEDFFAGGKEMTHKQAILESGRLGLDEAQLDGLPEDVLQALAESLEADVEEEDEEEEQEQEVASESSPDPAPVDSGDAEPCDVTALEARIVALEAQVKEGEAEKRAGLVADLATNSACAFTKERLAEMPVADLEALARSLSPADYSGQGGGPRANVKFEKYEMPALFPAQAD